MSKRKYWISFRVASKEGGHIGQGEMAVEREMPITDENALLDIARAIKTKLVKDAKGDAAADTWIVQVVNWTKFEEPSVVLAQTGDVEKLLKVS